MEAITEKDKMLTVKNILAACKDITKLNKRGYNYLYLANGFIAHYNLHGFIDYYSSANLADDILEHASANKWSNFTEGDRHFDYYKSKADVYARIVEGLTN
jgi:hypothetical protein